MSVPLFKMNFNVHKQVKLCGKPKNALLQVSDGLLSYVMSLLREETPVLPETSVEEWTGLLEILAPHWILPLLYWKASHLSCELRPPEKITIIMRDTFLWSRARCLQRERQLRNLLDAFNREKVPILVLKGLAFAGSIYPDPAMRPSDDIDLLTIPENFVKAREIFLNLGYQCFLKRFEASKDFENQEEFTLKNGSKNNCSVELHWDLHKFLGNKRNLDIREFFRRSINVESSALSFKTFNPIDGLIHAALHMVLSHNQDVRLIWIYDCALLARRLAAPNDWEMLKELSIARGARVAMENSLKMAEIWTGLKIPGGFNDWPEPSEMDKAVWFNAGCWTENPGVKIRLYLSSTSSLLEKARYLFRFIFPHPAILRRYFPYPPSSNWELPLTYLRHWGMWLSRFIRRF